MYKIAAVGDKDSVLGFSSIGVEVFCETDQRALLKLIHDLAEEEYGVIFITEQAAELASLEIERLSESVLPAIIPIPGVRGNNGTGMKNLKEFVEKAVGSDIIGV